MKVLLAVFSSWLTFCGQVLAAQPNVINGAVAYTEVIQFDYTKDGNRNNVQFWLEFKGSPAIGSPDEQGYTPESGAIYYYLVDIENKKKVDNWLMGFSMMEGPPPSGPYPMTGISINGNTAIFSAFGKTWTIIDGGDGYRADEVTINDGYSTRKMELFAGDLKIVGTETIVIASNQECAECHEGEATTILVKGGKHKALSCEECHVGHPPEEQHSYTGCLECHEPHTNEMGEDSCMQCHRAHTATAVVHEYNVPSSYCTSCHKEAGYVLATSRSKHSDMACVRCHREQHKASSTCQYCHGGPHPEHVMKKKDICATCHKTAHALESARPK